MEPILETHGLSIAFGGHVAVDSIDLTVSRKHFKSIIGPNGAGKTTLFNLLSGQLKPTSGQVIFQGADVTHLSPSLRTRLGMGRSFQITNVFPNLTVLENVRLAVQSQMGVHYNFIFHYTKYKSLEEEADRLLAMVFLEDKRDFIAKNLAHGEKRKLELAMLLALKAELLLLDEPTAGISIEEVPSILEVLRQIKQLGNQTILLIEHKMDMVLDLSDSITVLYNGRFLAEGTPSEVMDNELVQSAYLGGHYDGAS